MTVFKDQILQVREILQGDGRAYGAQAWFMKMMKGLGFIVPSQPTVHRWFTGKTLPSEDAMACLSSLSKDARELLRKKITSL